MNAQEIFDTVHRHLIEQGRQAMCEDRACMYRHPDGSKCAVGCLIPDDLYERDREGDSVDILIDDDRYAFLRPNEELLAVLQALHDNKGIRVGPDEWEAYVNSGMKNIAKAFYLKFAPRTKGAA